MNKFILTLISLIATPPLPLVLFLLLFLFDKMPHRETNPHFSRPLQPPREDHLRPPVQHQGHRGQPPRGSWVPRPSPALDDRPNQSQQPPVKILEPSPKPSTPLLPPPIHDPRLDPEPWRATPTGKPHHHDHKRNRHGGYRVPAPQKTKPYTWFAAVFCVIFWLVIIIGGLIVLIVYLVFRPQNPRFDVSNASLNAVYLDMGYLLNADLTVLANFTNPNKKVQVDFSSVIIDLYYGSTLIATQYVKPFSATRNQSRLANIHLVTSQVRLPLPESQRLMKQMDTNGVWFEVKGVFRARSNFGSMLRYSYNLYGHCSIMLTRAPDGVMIKRKCRTKR